MTEPIFSQKALGTPKKICPHLLTPVFILPRDKMWRHVEPESCYTHFLR